MPKRARDWCAHDASRCARRCSFHARGCRGKHSAKSGRVRSRRRRALRHDQRIHKSMRASDEKGAMYWLAKMLHAGEDFRFIARRIVVFASEDIGLADPEALPLAIATQQAV